MADPGDTPRPTRRGLVRVAAGVAAAATAGLGLDRQVVAEARSGIEPFWGRHQAGIVTPPQRHTYTAAFDLIAAKRDDVISLLQAWTAASAQMSGAETAPDSGDIAALPLARLTLTFGFGPGLFSKDDRDRYGVAAHRPAALVDLPQFDGDELIEARTGGDLSVQACADDPQPAFNAVRRLAQLARGLAVMRWAQTGYLPSFGPQQKPRNLMGFRDGTNNLPVDDPSIVAQFVWVGDEGPAWMRNGSYVVFRRIRIALEHWDRMPPAFQQQAFGRHKLSGAPLGQRNEADPVDLQAVGGDGEPVIPESAHIRLAAAATNDGARILRRSYSYNDGVDVIVERWPPWHRGNTYDAGLLFICYQRDPRNGFIKIFSRLAKSDMLNQFVTHTGGGVFACPGGAGAGEYIGQRLFAAA